MLIAKCDKFISLSVNTNNVCFGCDVLSALQLDVERGEGLEANHVVHHTGRVGVVRTVVELLDHTTGVLERLEPTVKSYSEIIQ